jgi:arsenate reductase
MTSPGDAKEHTMTMTRTAAAVTIAIVALLSVRGSALKMQPAPLTVLFVCEHGAAKSVIAAAHFNKIAKERGLPFRGVARGTAPDPTIPVGVRQGLERAGLELSVTKPMMVGQADMNAADRVVTFEIALPSTVSASKTAATDWKAVPSVSADFGVASAEIKRRVEALIAELSKK